MNCANSDQSSIIENSDEECNKENLCIIEENSIYTKANRLLIAKIVYQCIDCQLISNTINEIYSHYFDSHHAIQQSDKSISVEHIDSTDDHKQLSKPIATNTSAQQSKNDVKVSQNKKCKSNRISDETLKLVNCNAVTDKSGKTVFKCEDCDNSYSRVDSLRRHRNIHKNPEVCWYPDCGKLFATYKDLSSHIKVHQTDKAKSFKCDECGRAYNREESLNVHKKMHTNPLRCEHPGCERVFSSRALMRTHAIMHSSDAPYACDWPGCDFTTKRVHSVNAHKSSVHSTVRAFKCEWPECKEAFKNATSLKVHVSSVHKKERIYECEWPGCGKQLYNSKQQRLRHRRTHTGEKPFACDWPLCERWFSDPNVLVRHKITHTGERPFCCDWPSCGARFGTAVTLNTHKKLVHKCDYIKRTHLDKKKVKK